MSSDAVGQVVQVPLWGRWEHSFEAGDQTPPTTQLNVELISPSGQRHVWPGFWDGGQRWRVRWMPDEEGDWHFQTRSTPVDPQLQDQKGIFRCARVKEGGRFLEHGALRVAADGFHFEHADGTPFFLLADTVWNGPLLSKPADWDRFLGDRVNKQFNGIQFVTHAPFIAAYTNAEGEVACTGLEEMPVNPHFFRRIDARIDAINAQGLLALPVLLWAAAWSEAARQYDLGWRLPEAQLIQIARYQVARYGAHHVAWILPGDGQYERAEAEKWKRIGQAVFEGDESASAQEAGTWPPLRRAPVMLHPAGMHWPYPQFADARWLDVAAYQSSHCDDAFSLRWIHSGPPAQHWTDAPARPVVNIEPPYEDHIAGGSRERFNAYRVRRACYWSVLCAPPAGVTYGAHGVWSWAETAQTPLNHPSTGMAKPWHIAKDLPGSFDMQRLAHCFNALAWWTLRPDERLLLEQPGMADPARFISSARSEKGDLAVLYLPVGGKVALAADRLAEGLEGYWFDPRTGQSLPAPAHEGNRFEAPDEQDWVLVLRRSA
jgi:hypothetical protein